ncbi:hypothetical protein AV530_000610 [Patagioenas fasciata monilis]|uniref:Uncharacterized protein n=1 Tax=Patagioenas fasciata monilis TaxID=372326 RepID=A0A1V4IFZ2_PATFA|nr:hypothetical protein AV530_000610 [Patagioenas fasciata monilis]
MGKHLVATARAKTAVITSLDCSAASSEWSTRLILPFMARFSLPVHSGKDSPASLQIWCKFSPANTSLHSGAQLFCFLIEYLLKQNHATSVLQSTRAS